MTLRLLFSILLILSLKTISAGQEVLNLVLEGTLSKSSIVMELNIKGKNVSGGYYYKRFKKTLSLYGGYINGETIEVVYKHWDNKETFTLKDIGKGTDLLYSGTWKNEKSNTSLPVTLRLADVSKIPVKNLYVKKPSVSEYDYIRLAEIKLKKDSVQIIKPDFSITWYSDSILNFNSFSINQNKSLKGIDSINDFLERLHFTELLSYFDCNGSEYSSEIYGVYLRGKIISFAQHVSYECGGAHPDFGINGYTFNLETGKQMELTDFLYFGKTKKDYPPDRDYKLGDEIMGPNIVKLLTKLYPDEMIPRGENEEECDYSGVDCWDYTPWYLSDKGLYLYPVFYRAARNCDGAGFSFIPYNVLSKYKNPKVNIPMEF